MPIVKRSLSLRSSVLVILSVCLLIGAVELQALRANEPHVAPASALSAAECIRCHSDVASLRRMWEKEDGAHFLFNPDGTFKASTLPGGSVSHPGRTAIEKALQGWNAAPRVGATDKSLLSQKNTRPRTTNPESKGDPHVH